MRNHALLSAAGLLAASLVAGSAQAALFNAVWNGTVSSSDVAAITAGDSAAITLALDNGGSSLASQTWAMADLQFVTFEFGTTQTTFIAPFGGGVDLGIGSFTTDADGVLTAVLSFWADFNVGSDYTTNLAPAIPSAWFLNGANIVFSTNAGAVGLANVESLTSPAAWTVSPAGDASVPVPATTLLLAAGLLSLRRFNARRVA